MNYRMIRAAGVVTSIMFAATFSACKKSGTSTGGTSDSFPARVGEAGDATATVKLGTIGKSGGKRLTVDLERLPEYGSANLWACYQLPADNFQFGKAVCSGDASKSVDITAMNLDFTCEVNRDFGIVKARNQIVLEGCDTYDIYVYVFRPSLDIRIVE
jgi:hypothetical protein